MPYRRAKFPEFGLVKTQTRGHRMAAELLEQPTMAGCDIVQRFANMQTRDGPG
jgi:hypothetical protein